MCRFLTTLLLLSTTIYSSYGQEERFPGYFDRAEKYLTLADSLKTRIVSESLEDSTVIYYWDHIGLAQWYLGNFDSSRVCFHKSLAHAEKLGLMPYIINSYSNLAIAHKELGNRDSVEFLKKKIFSYWLDDKDQFGQYKISTRYHLTQYFLEKDDYYVCYKLMMEDDLFTDTLNYEKLYYHLNMPRLAAKVYTELALDSLVVESYHEQIRRGMAFEENWHVSNALFQLGRHYFRQGRYDTSTSYYFKYIDFLEANYDSVYLGLVYNNIGNNYLSLGNDSLTAYYLQESLRLSSDTDDETFHCIGNLFQLYLKQGRKSLAIPYIVKFDSMFDAGLVLGNSEDYPETLYRYFEKEGDFEKALKYYQEWVRATEANDNSSRIAEFNRQRALDQLEEERTQAQTAAQQQTHMFQKGILGGIVALCIVGLATFTLTRFQQKRREERYLAELRHSELKALRAQINPHFIFNALSSIQRFILQHHAQEANIYLTKFSRFIRLVLYHSDKHVISVQDELTALRQYLDIEKLRLGNRFTYSVEIDESLDLEGLELPSMLLQTFAENAIWHGISPKEGVGHVTIQVQSREDGYQIVLADDGIGREASVQQNQLRKGHTSRGMSMVAEKIQIFNQSRTDKVVYQIEDVYDTECKPAGTRVILEVNTVKQRKPYRFTTA